ncbi:MAG: D-alanyl-D-alanine carboxypeptidase [Rhodobacteraceae bacterium]|nr:D-alanyl-D-alanine carboxypeptidase [Paracoccaceae bacterium]
MLARFFLIFTLIAGQAWAQSFDTKARAAYVLDQRTGMVLLNKNGDEPLPPASMSKLMTLFMTFEAIQRGTLSIDEKLPVSAHAASFGGSTMFLDTRDRVSVEDLIRGIIVLSGNDACVVLAEALSPDGTEAGFARMMTARARELGMVNSTFQNSSGWPAAGHRMSMKDLAILADQLIRDFPTYYPLFAETEFAFDGRAPSNTRNRNPLLRLDIGADGLKTGHTQAAGYGLVGSAKQGNRRIIFVVTGLETQEDRAEESERLVNWAFRQFAEKVVAPAGNRIAEADVHMGDDHRVGLTTAEDVVLLIPTIGAEEIEAHVSYDSPVQAPIEEGQRIGELVISIPGFAPTRTPLIASESIGVGGFVPRLRTATEALRRQFLSGGETEGGA